MKDEYDVERSNEANMNAMYGMYDPSKNGEWEQSGEEIKNVIVTVVFIFAALTMVMGVIWFAYRVM